MNTELTVRETHYQNEYLKTATDNIRQLDMNIRSGQMGIAFYMGRIDAIHAYKDDGYDSAVEWAMDAFGIEKTLAYNLIAIGRDYIVRVKTNDGKTIGFATRLVMGVSDAPNNQPADLVAIADTMPANDYTVNQLSRMKSLGYEAVKKAHNDGEISPATKSRDIDAYVKARKVKRITAEQPAPASSEQPAEQPQTLSEPRPENLDDMSTALLIAELRARGFRVYKGEKEYTIDWSNG